MTILVTGGAGYIGSHVVRQLGERNESVVVLDNLSSGFRSAVLHGELVVGDTGDRELVGRVLREHGIDTVMHFAAHTIVPESVSNPLKYYGNNTCSTRSLLQCCQEAGVKHFVFSSTAAVYGIPAGGIASEDRPPQPINPYGTSKLMSEWMLRDLGAATALRYVVLRYFNVAGSRPRRAHRAVDAQRDAAHQGGVRSRGRQASARLDFRHRLSDAGRHRRARLHPRRGSRRAPPERARLPARRRCVADAQLRLRPRLQRARSASRRSSRLHGQARSRRSRSRAAPATRRRSCRRPTRIREVLGWPPRHDDLEAIVRSQLAWEHRLQREPQLQQN